MNKIFYLFLTCAIAFPLTEPLLNSKSYAADTKQIEFAADHPPYLDEFVMNAEPSRISLSITVANPFDHEIKTLLLNGVSQKITILITTKVNRINLFLVKFNREINDMVYTHSISYDNLKKLFTVGSNDTKKTMETTSYKEALQWASEFKDITLLQGSQISLNQSYQVEAQAEIRKARLPFHLEYLFFFLSAWDRKSTNYTIDIPERLISAAITR